MKLLVTTDFSANSKGAIRFAQMLSKQSSDIDVTFYHSIIMMKPSSWSDLYFKAYKKEEIARLTAELEKFVLSTIGKDKNNFAKINFVIDPAISTEKDIISYAEKTKKDFICIATQGAGMLRKIMGTHTSYIVKNSKVPVMVIPSHYRPKALKNLTYLSDFENIKKEMDKVSKFSGAVNCKLNVLHYSTIVLDKKKFDKGQELFNTDKYKNNTLQIVKNNLEKSLVENITQHISKAKPEALVMFTKREKSFFESLFIPSKSAELVYSTKIPVLIYSK